MFKNERKIYFYSALLITLMLNSAKLMALNTHSTIAMYWQFNIWEYGFQFLYNLLFCLLLLHFNLDENQYFGVYRKNKQWFRLYTLNGLFVLVAIVLGSLIHYKLFGTERLPRGIARGYFVRFLMSTLMIIVIIRLILLIRENKHKDFLNEQLHNAYLQAQLKLLQEQLNPHFLFNTLSSLSAIVHENPKLAQTYIVHLSKVFRYTLELSKNDLVTVETELQHLSSYSKLLEMRLENAFRLHIQVHPDILQDRLPHLSLQPLVENAAKHNSATTDNILTINVYSNDGFIIVENKIIPKETETAGTGLGLANLNERFRLQTSRHIEIHQINDYFIVKLPLLASTHHTTNNRF